LAKKYVFFFELFIFDSSIGKSIQINGWYWFCDHYQNG